MKLFLNLWALCSTLVLDGMVAAQNGRGATSRQSMPRNRVETNSRGFATIPASSATTRQVSSTPPATVAPPVETSLNISSNSTEQFVSSCGPRIRKSWDMMLPQEKDVYLRAIERSMDDGLYIKFVEIHTEQMTSMEAHRTCMFVYWHRVFLLGFENMLRAYGGEFSCITIPYWNYADHNALYLSGACRSMEECSPILREMGGSFAGIEESVDINGTPIEGTCVQTPPANHFCEASHLTGNACAHCVPRGDWSNTGFPPTASISSLIRQLFTNPTIAGVADNLEQGIHNTIHNSLGGAMGFLEAPADPIFYSHHASIDLLHSIFYHCAVGNTVPLSLEQQLSDPRIYTECERRTSLGRGFVDSNVLFPESGVMLRSGEEGINPQSVFSPQNVLDPFFASLPDEYLGLSDIRDIGAFSYNYEMTGLFADLFTTCGGLSVPQSAIAEDGPVRKLESTSTKPGLVEAVIMPSEHSTSWYTEALQAAQNITSSSAQELDMNEALEEVEKMTCMFYNECRGKVRDYSDGVRQRFHTLDHTPCSGVINAVESGQDAIKVANWKEIFLRHFECDQ